jgi:hypothetical protein
MKHWEFSESINNFFLEKVIFSRIILFCLFFLALYSAVIFLNLDTLHSVLDNHWQTADIEGLKKDPVNALLHLHSQPPLFNFFFWLFATIPGGAYDNFVLFNCLCQSLIALIVFEIASQFLKARLGGLAIAALYLFSPPVLLNSAYAFYPALTSMGFAILLYGFFVINRQPRYASVLIGFSVCYLYMIRSSFSLPAAIILLCVYIYLSRKVLAKTFILSTVACSLLLLLSLPIKNYVLYGFFGSSSWTPLNLIMTFSVKTPLGPFATPEEIRKAYPNLECKKSYGLLDTENKKANGEPNYNSCYYIAYLNELSPSIIKNFNLLIYLRNIKHNVGAYFDTPDGYYFLKNRDKIESYTFAYNLSFLTLFFKFHQIRVACILLIFYLIYRVKKDREQFPVVLLIILALHFFAHTLTDGGESRRHVFDIEFTFYLIFAMVISSWHQRRVTRISDESQSHPNPVEQRL